jgi:ankyrin repeat protein
MFTARRKKNDCGDADADSLLAAAANGDLAEVKRLVVDCGVDPNVQDDLGWTPLHRAASGGYLKVVELLLEHDADPNVQDNDGWTPLHYAVKGFHVDVVRVLLDHGADPTIRDNEGRAPLDYGNDCEEIIEELRRRSGATTVYK